MEELTDIIDIDAQNKRNNRNMQKVLDFMLSKGEIVATCKDCIHYFVCIKRQAEAEFKENPGLPCESFMDRTRTVDWSDSDDRTTTPKV